MDIEQLSEEIQFNFAQIARENPMMALSLASGMLVALIENQAESQGHDHNKEITIDGNGEFRNITIHAKG